MTSYSKFLQDDGFIILLFHGVITRQRWQVRNYNQKHVSVARFAEIIEDLAEHGTAVSMPEIVKASENGTQIPTRAFAITFDDGFENNYTLAAPVLERMNIPSTFYVTTGFIDDNAASWVDLIDQAVEAMDEITLDLPFSKLQGTFRTTEEKIELLNRIRSLIKNDSTIDPYRFAEQFRKQLGMGPFVPDSELDQKMTWEQVRQLSEHDLFTVGGHSHTHRILDFLEKEDLEHEIAISIEKVSDAIGTTPTHYSYPEGMVNCYSDRVIRLLRSHNVVCSPSAIHGTNRVGDDLFHLKRIMAA